MKYKHLMITISFIAGVITTSTTAQLPNAVPENRYGLKVMTSKKEYEAAVKSDSNNRMVLLKNYIFPLLTHWPYATTHNFTHTVLYHHPEALVRLPVAKALAAVQNSLREKKLSLLFYDAYRPYSITEKMWAIVPDERYAANPATGSGHNKGIAVDVTLADITTGKPVAMPTAFDDFSEKAHHSYHHPNSTVRANKALLKAVMEQHGFVALPTEWWHYFFNFPSGNFTLLDLPFSLLINNCSGENTGGRR